MVLITPQQLKTANLIFNEHQNFKIINTLQREQIEKYEILYKDELLIDSMYQCTIDDLTVDLEFYKESLNKADKKLKRKSRIANILSGVSASLFIVVLCLILFSVICYGVLSYDSLVIDTKVYSFIDPK